MATQYVDLPEEGIGGGVTTLNGLSGALTLVAGSGISITTNSGAGTITITNTAGGAGSFTAGSVIFAGSTGALAQDNANFFWNDTNFSLGLGTNTPASNTIIDAVNTTGAAKSLRLTGYGVGSSVGVKGQFARGTLLSPTPAQSGDLLNFFSGTGYGTSFPASTGVINIVAGETFSGTSNATYLQFEVTPTGSITKSEAMRIAPTGDVLIGTTTDSGTQKLQVNGNSNVGTVTAGVWNGTQTSGNSFITSGTTYTTPAGITTATLFKFTLVGGGGGGGGFAAAGTSSSGGGAGGAGVVWVTGLSPSTAYTISIGAAGTGGIATTPGSAGAGGNTTLTIGATTYTANGGTGSPGGSTNVNGGAGGTATGFTINIKGQNGHGSDNNDPTSGGAGGSPGFGLGMGGASLGASGVGNPGTGFGGGGGGAHGTGNTGGAGAAGCIVVEWQN